MVDFNMATMSGHDAPALGQSKAQTTPGFTPRKERVEQVLADFGTNPWAVI